MPIGERGCDSATFACGEVGQIFLGGLDNRHFASQNRKSLQPPCSAGAGRDGSAYYPSQKEKHQPERVGVFLGGRGWIRTTEGEASRFTVCPLWPLGNSPKSNDSHYTTAKSFCQGKNLGFFNFSAPFGNEIEISLDERGETCYTFSVLNRIRYCGSAGRAAHS